MSKRKTRSQSGKASGRGGPTCAQRQAHDKGKDIIDRERIYRTIIIEAAQGQFASLRAACQFHGELKSYHTINRRRLHLTKPAVKARSRQQIMTEPQERVLSDWMRFLGICGYGLSMKTIAPKVMELCGQKKKKKKLDQCRARAFNFTTVNDNFQKISKVLAEYHIPLRNTFNMDEIGSQMGGGRNGGKSELFFFSEEDQMRYGINSDNLELFTAIETICADGTAFLPNTPEREAAGKPPPSVIKPMLIFKGQQTWPNECIALSENGWTNNELCRMWFDRDFLPGARAHADLEGEGPDGKKKKILLIWDGHNSHSVFELAKHAYENDVIIFQLPPHTTHRLQPCDVGAFAPLKAAWQARVAAREQATGEAMHVRWAVKDFLAARRDALKPNTIRSAWCKAGYDVSHNDPDQPLRPNPELFTEADYAPAKSFSTQAQLPSSFPPPSLAPASPAPVEDDEEEDGEEDEDDEDLADVIHAAYDRTCIVFTSQGIRS
ncbi:DDE-domain-containing protein [Peniophora sp. CONT]|nr:DDE-domain-containing protein [Peniophora sp. CONT]